MLSFANLILYLWTGAISTACFTHNRSFINNGFLITPYKILNNRKPNVKFFHVFGSMCFIFIPNENRKKFDVKADEGMFMGNSLTSKAYRVLNKKSRRIEETYYVIVDDINLNKYQKANCQFEEVFPSANLMTITLSFLYEEFPSLFNDPDKSISS